MKPEATRTGTRVNKSERIHQQWESYRKNKSVAARNALIEHYTPIVNRLAEIMARRLWPRVTADELALSLIHI